MSDKRSEKLRPQHRFSARTRLAFSYAVLVITCGAVLLTVLVTYLGLGPEYAFGPVETDADGESVIIVPENPEDLGGSFSVEVKSREDLIALLITVSALVLVLLAALSSRAAWWLAGRMLRPLAQINEAAQIAARGRLDHRIGLSGPRDEIVSLAQTFDAMLDSLQRYNEAQRRFAANASHELRTPLAATRTILDVALAKPDPVDRDVLERLLQLNERSARTVESLLDLAEAEAGQQETTTVDLSEVVGEVLEHFAPKARERGLRLELDLRPATIVGDERLLLQMVQNLTENAIRHNREGGLIAMRTETVGFPQGELRSRLRIESAGEMIDPEVVAGLTEPFRTAGGRTAGNSRGLGLAIVASIVEVSQGTLDLAARPDGGLIVTVSLPHVEQESEADMGAQDGSRAPESP